jgi:hypothetical protein
VARIFQFYRWTISYANARYTDRDSYLLTISAGQSLEGRSNILMGGGARTSRTSRTNAGQPWYGILAGTA